MRHASAQTGPPRGLHHVSCLMMGGPGSCSRGPSECANPSLQLRLAAVVHHADAIHMPQDACRARRSGRGMARNASLFAFLFTAGRAP